MLENIIKSAIKEINKLDGVQYEYRKGNDKVQPSIYIKGTIENVIFDLSLIQSITVTNNSLILFENSSITILSASNYTWHET